MGFQDRIIANDARNLACYGGLHTLRSPWRRETDVTDANTHFLSLYLLVVSSCSACHCCRHIQHTNF
jgi:hypothetical protein